MIIDVIREQISIILTYRIHEWDWRISQIFAFFALVTMFWSFQIKDKLKMMLLLGLGTTFLAVSAALLGNWTLTMLFGIASVRNYVFCYFEWRGLKKRPVARGWWYFFAGVFIATTVASTVFLVYFAHHFFDALPFLYDPYSPFAYGVNRHSNWLEWAICITLIGLVIGNVISGTNIMRISFVANRVFNIINHWYFNNIIAVFIACMTISSNIIFYIRQLVSYIRKRRREKEISEKFFEKD